MPPRSDSTTTRRPRMWVERIVIETPDDFQPGDILIPKTYAAELERNTRELRALRPRYDSLAALVDTLYRQIHYDDTFADSLYRAREQIRAALIDSIQADQQQDEERFITAQIRRDVLASEIYDLGADVVESQSLLRADIRRAKLRHREVKRLARQKRTGFARWLIYNATHSTAGKVILAANGVGMIVVGTAAIISTLDK